MRIGALLAVLAVILGTAVEMLLWGRDPGVSWPASARCPRTPSPR